MSRRKNAVKLSILIFFTAAFVFWISRLANQQPLGVLFPTFFLVLVAGAFVFWKRLRHGSYFYAGSIGAAIGYIAMIVVSLILLCVVRRFGCFNNDWSGHLYFFPTVSMGWLYGMICYLLVFGGESSNKIE